jgi:hypothetical protein
LSYFISETMYRTDFDHHNFDHRILFWLILIYLEKSILYSVMVFKASFNTISVNIVARSVILVEETGVLAENHHPAASHWQTLSLYVVSSTHLLSVIRTHDISGDMHWSSYHTITTTTTPLYELQYISVSLDLRIRIPMFSTTYKDMHIVININMYW